MAEKGVFLQGSFHFSVIVIAALLSLGLTSCASYRTMSDDSFSSDADMHHLLYSCIPRHRSQIKWYDVGHWTTWALCGNDDDGIFGEKVPFRKEEPNDGKKALRWWFRNPLHNFCFYVIGSAHRKNSEFTLFALSKNRFQFLWYTPEAKTTFFDKGTSLYLGFHGWKPFFSLRVAYTPSYCSDFYLGWRSRGNFGVKCLPLTKLKS